MEWIKLTKTAIKPVRATKFSAGYDFHADETVTLNPLETKVIKTGVSFKDMPKDQYLQMSLRSGISIKTPFLMANGVGIIDSDYAGNEIGIILFNSMPNMKATVDKGTKLAQCVLLKYHTIEGEKEVTRTRIGGYGHTDELDALLDKN